MTRRRVPDDSATFEFSDEERDETLKVSTHRTASRSQDASKGELLRRERIGRRGSPFPVDDESWWWCLIGPMHPDGWCPNEIKCSACDDLHHEDEPCEEYDE